MVYIHSPQGQFSGFHFLISLLKSFAVSNSFNSLGTISQILGPGKEMLSVPLKTLGTFRLANSKWELLFRLSNISLINEVE